MCRGSRADYIGTRELIPSSPAAELRVKRTFSNFSGTKDRVQEQFGLTEDWYRQWGDGDGDDDAMFRSKHRIEAFGLLMSSIGCDAI